MNQVPVIGSQEKESEKKKKEESEQGRRNLELGRRSSWKKVVNNKVHYSERGRALLCVRGHNYLSRLGEGCEMSRLH